MAKKKSTAPCVVVDPEFRDLIPPQTKAERAALERDVARNGVRDPLTVGRIGKSRDLVLLDGYNRHEIADARGLSYMTTTLDFPDRAAAKTWMFENQVGRRNLSEDQIVMLAAMRGIETDRGTALKRERAAALASAGKGGPVLAGKLTIALAYGAAFPRPKREPVPRHPDATGFHVPPGHELAARTTQTRDGAEVGAWDKTKVAPEEGVEPVLEAHQVVRRTTYLGPDGKVRATWVAGKPDEVTRERLMLEAWSRHAALYAGLAGVVPAPGFVDVDLCTLYPIGDPHIGMLAWAPETGDHFDTTIGVRDLAQCARMLVAGAPASKLAIVSNLGDAAHAQDDMARTPGHGNQLDVDGRFATVLDALHAVLRTIIDAALSKHERVIFRNLPGNHDPRVAAELAMWAKAWYRDEPRLTVADAFAAHQYDRFGACLFGWHHGDRTPAGELPAIMATDRAQDWGETTERVWHVGHVHHLTRKESPGCVVETHRTLAGRDAWHAGRYRAERSLSAITYHRTFGEVTRGTVNLAKVRAALAAGKAA